MEKYHVELEHWNGGEKELVTGKPVEWEKAMQLKEALRMESRSGEFFVNIVKEETKEND